MSESEHSSAASHSPESEAVTEWMKAELAAETAEKMTKMLEDEIVRKKAEAKRLKKLAEEEERRKSADLALIPATYLKIGDYEVFAIADVILKAKFHFGHEFITWEASIGSSHRHRIETPLSNVVGIWADKASGTMEVELDQPPSFKTQKEKPTPLSHNLFEKAEDFTGGQALSVRRHFLRFIPGVLDQPYAKLVRTAPQLLRLSRSSFPYYKSPYFSESEVYMPADIGDMPTKKRRLDTTEQAIALQRPSSALALFLFRHDMVKYTMPTYWTPSNVAKMWNTIPIELKKPYVDQAAEFDEEYEKALASEN